MRRLTKRDIENVIGQTIEGYCIEAARVKNGPFIDSDHYRFVLAQNAHGDYVTWQFHLLDNGTVTAYWGHFFGNNWAAAIQDFDNRDKE